MPIEWHFLSQLDFDSGDSFGKYDELQFPHRFSEGLQSGECAAQSSNAMFFSAINCIEAAETWQGALSGANRNPG